MILIVGSKVSFNLAFERVVKRLPRPQAYLSALIKRLVIERVELLRQPEGLLLMYGMLELAQQDFFALGIMAGLLKEADEAAKCFIRGHRQHSGRGVFVFLKSGLQDV